jgi:hypothetical protein
MASETATTISVLPKSRGLVDFTASQLDISLQIIDPCEPYAATLVVDPVSDVTYTLSEATVTISTTWTLTPSVDTITAADCKGVLTAVIPDAIGATPANSAEHVTFSTDTTEITIPVATDPTMAGTHDIVISYASRGGVTWPNISLTVRIIIIDPCEPTHISVAATTPATASTYVFNEAEYTETFTWVVTPSVLTTTVEDCAVTWRMDAPAAITTDQTTEAVTHTPSCTNSACTSALVLP